MTIQEFHARRISHIKYAETDHPMHTVADFYDEFLIAPKRLPDPETVKKWHDLIARYANDEANTTFIVRKYSGGKKDNVWNNRRGAVVRFKDGFEVVYADNFLAHEVLLMACCGFVPEYEDFKKNIDERTLHITSGTEVEKKLRLYPAASKQCGAYLAHIMDVNGSYVREDNAYREVSTFESNKIYPLGTPEDWTASPDRIYHTDYTLRDEEKSLVKAHFMRFLDPMNYYITPETKHCVHTVASLAENRNIGEYSHLTYYVQQQYMALYGGKYLELLKLAGGKCVCPDGYSKSSPIDLEISFSAKTKAPGATKPTAPAVKKPKSPSTKPNKIEFIPADTEKFKSLFIKRGSATVTVTYNDGRTEVRTWTCRRLSQHSNVRSNVSTQSWFEKDKNVIAKVVCEVL